MWYCPVSTLKGGAVRRRDVIALATGAAAWPVTGRAQQSAPSATGAGRELPVRRIPNIGNAAEFYFSPDGRSLIGNARREGDDQYHVYTLNLDGSGIRR